MIGMAKPGDLDPSFDLELRAWVTPDHVTIAPDGRRVVWWRRWLFHGGYWCVGGNSWGEFLPQGRDAFFPEGRFHGFVADDVFGDVGGEEDVAGFG
jgi:hypothetical protein